VNFDPKAMSMLLAYPWPGNVRELENTLERAAVSFEGSEILVTDLPEHLQKESGESAGPERGVDVSVLYVYGFLGSHRLPR
jgi:DNA-binding NtrC family response regulator